MKFIHQVEPLIGEEEKRAMVAYLDSGGWLTEFKKTREFEERIAEYLGVPYVSVVNNGTVSLAVAIMALDIKGQDEVIVPDYTMIGSANAVVLAGATPVFADIDPATLCLDLEKVEEAVSEQTKAVMLVTINGRYPEMETFTDFCKARNLYLIEDAAQSFGSAYKGKRLGTFGEVGSFSFSPHKIITTGQGGCLVTENEELYQKIEKIKDFGRIQSGVDKHETMGFNFKFTDLQAVIGIEQIKSIEWRVQRKKEIFRLYRELLKDTKEIGFLETDLTSTVPWFVDILVEPALKNKLAEFLREKGVGTRPFYPALHTQTPYAFVRRSFDAAESISQKGLWLPSSLGLKDEEVDYVSRTIKEFFERTI